jgi:hypothetical protein
MASSCAFLLVLLSSQGCSVLAEVNVYGKLMADCGADHAAGCTYAQYDAGAHQVCVTQLPHGFSANTGQGSWSDEYTGQPWCICIWAYSNYILQNKDLPLKCDSIPAKVLEEQYSLDKFQQCGAMSSTTGCGAEDIRRSIQSLCQQCDDQGKDQASKSTLKAKCDKILATAAAAPMQRLDDVSAVQKATLRLNHGSSVSPLAGVACALTLSAMLVFLAVSRRRSNASELTTPQESYGQIE